MHSGYLEDIFCIAHGAIILDFINLLVSGVHTVHYFFVLLILFTQVVTPAIVTKESVSRLTSLPNSLNFGKESFYFCYCYYGY